MSEFEFIKEPDKTGKQKTNNLKAILFSRWFCLIAGIPAFFLAQKSTLLSFVIVLSFLGSLGYNLWVSAYTKSFYMRMKRLPNWVTYVDIVLLCFFAYQTGGVDSDVYLVFLFILCFGEMYKFLSNTRFAGIFCVFAYSFACILHSTSFSFDLNWGKLFLRISFLLLAALATSCVTVEIKKYHEMHRKEFKRARTDKLTGLPNRHYLEQKLAEEAQYADFSGTPLNILIFDLDNFKKFNDTFGHTWGDKLLALFSDIIKESIRKTDIPIRYGGEEFILLVRELDIEMAKSVADRIRRQLEKQKIYVGENENRTRVTVSCGIAQYPGDSRDVKEVIEFADKALYHAKELGKNMSVAYREIGKLKRPVQIDIEMYMKG